jgi:hypothetical protein
MNPVQLRVHIEAYPTLRRSLGFQTAPEAYNLRELSDYVEAHGFTGSVSRRYTADFPGRECA